MLVDSLMSGKGNRHIVSLLIPADTVTVMKKLADFKVCEAAGVTSEPVSLSEHSALRV